MDVFESIYYIRIYKFLSFSGHWPYLKSKTQIIHQTLLMLVTISVAVPQTTVMLYLDNFRDYVLAIPGLCYYIQFFFKCTFFVLRRKEIKKVLDKIKKDFIEYKGEDLQVLNDFAKMAHRANQFYFYYMFIAVSAYSVVPFTLHCIEISIPGNFTLLPDKPRNIKYFSNNLDNSIFFMIFHGSIADLSALVFLIGFDTLTFNFGYHASALFVIITKKMQKSLESDRFLNESNKNYEEICYNNLVETVILHKEVLEFIKNIEAAFSDLYFLIIGCALVPMTIAQYEVVLNKGSYGEMLRFMFFVSGELGHIIYYNWPGQKISDHSLLIHQSCYNCGWYKEGVPNKCKKLLNFMMLISQKPCYLTAAKVYILGFEYLAAVVKLSMSYFTVLSSMM